VARSSAPWWLWRVAWLSLATVLAISIGGALLLGLGAADPPRAGSLQWQLTNQSVWNLTPGVEQSQVTGDSGNFVVPAPPFTLEVTARLSTTSDLGAQWVVVLQPLPPTATAAPEVITVDGGGNYRETSSDQRITFPHLRSVGQTNLLRVDVDANGVETIRFNDEIAWRGSYRPGLSTARLSLLGFGGWQLDYRLIWELIALYAPGPQNDSAPSQTADA
jgi:hypothetical protein